VRSERLDVGLEPFLLGGQRYEASPATVVAGLELSQPGSATMLDLRVHARLVGPCMRCLGDAGVDADVAAREFHDPDARPGDDLWSDYVVEDQLQVGSWTRDAIALEIPDQILCRPDCAGLCPVCGRDLNVEPHEHAESQADPRWAVLAELREDL
jgi:uncharacterized protein